MTKTCCLGLEETRRVKKKKNDEDLLLRVRRDEKRTEKNDADILLRVRLD